MNVVARMKFELGYYNASVQYVSPNVTGTPPRSKDIKRNLMKFEKSLRRYYKKTSILIGCPIRTALCYI